jgi:AbrB family looped-hinge helix DNA binding protein
MAIVTLSSKYQIVIPKELRKKLQIKPGQKLRIEKLGDDALKIQTGSALDKYVGSLKGAWGEDSDKYLRELRDEWEGHQKRLDDLRK